jgi:hypothetical protein
MGMEQRLLENLEWHVIHGAPYFIRDETEGEFKIVLRTSTLFVNGIGRLVSEVDSDINDLTLGEDIEEFKPENIRMGFLVEVTKSLDFQIVRGLRHLARSEGALYVAFQNPYGDNSYGTTIPSLNKTLVLARFFNRKYDAGMDPFILEPQTSISNNA